MKYLKTYEVNKWMRDIKDQPFIKEMRKCPKGSLLYHSINDDEIIDPESDSSVLFHQKRLHPRDTYLAWHNYMRDSFIDKWDWNPREDALFCHTDKFKYITEWNYTFIVIPIENFKYMWNKDIEDLYVTIRGRFPEVFMGAPYTYKSIWQLYYRTFPSLDKIDNSEYYEGKQAPDLLKRKIRDLYKDLEEYVDKCKNTGLCKYIKSSEGEIMIKAKEYLLLDKKYIHDVEKEIWGK